MKIKCEQCKRKRDERFFEAGEEVCRNCQEQNHRDALAFSAQYERDSKHQEKRERYVVEESNRNSDRLVAPAKDYSGYTREKPQGHSWPPKDVKRHGEE